MTCAEELVINDVVEKADVKTLSMLVASVLSYNIEKMSVSKKIFRLSQLIIDFLLHYKKHSIFKFNDKVCIVYCLSFKNINIKRVVHPQVLSLRLTNAQVEITQTLV